MTRELALAIMIAFGILLLLGMTFSILRRKARARRLGPLPTASDVSGEILASFNVIHVATTVANTPMERVWANPLAYRAKTRIDIRSGGLTLALTGEGDLGIPRDSLSGCGRGTWTIDKAVDPDGLIVVTWTHANEEFDSYFRSVDHPTEDIVGAITATIPEKPKESA
jgi:hypothetical protein